MPLLETEPLGRFALLRLGRNSKTALQSQAACDVDSPTVHYLDLSQNWWVKKRSKSPELWRFPRCRSASPPFQQPSSTSTVRRGGLSTASLSTSTTKSDARHERKDHPGRGIASPASAMPYALGPRSACPTGGLGSRAKRKHRFIS